jgi:hypothetical protein
VCAQKENVECGHIKFREVNQSAASFCGLWHHSTRLALAAVFGEVGEQIVHASELGSVNQVAATGFGTHQTGVADRFEVKRQSAGRNLQQGGEGTGGQTLGTGHHQGAEGA